MARLVPTTRKRSPRKLGTLRGRLRIAKDFDAPLPDDLLALFEGGAVATWEIAIKAALGKIDVEVHAVVRAARQADFDQLPITVAHAARVQHLPAHHRDPFDRLLVAQGLEERLTLVTHDVALARYGVSILWE